MADTSTQNDTQEEQLNPQSQQREDSDTIAIRQPFNLGGQDRIVYDISVDSGPKLTFGWKIKPGSVVEVSGSGLDIYDQIILWISGSREDYRELDRSRDGRIISFKVRDNLDELYAEGSPVELEFINSRNAEQNRYLKQQFRIAAETEEQKKQRRVKQEQAEAERIKSGQGISAEQSLNSALAAAGSVAATGSVGSTISGGDGKVSQVGTRLTNNEPDDSDEAVIETEGVVNGSAVSSAPSGQTQTTLNQTVAERESEVQVKTAGRGESSVLGSVESQINSSGQTKINSSTEVSSSTETQTQTSSNVSSSGRVESIANRKGSTEANVSGTVSGQTAQTAEQESSVKSSGSAETSAKIGATVSGQVSRSAQVESQTEAEVKSKTETQSEQNQSVKAQASEGSEVGSRTGPRPVNGANQEQGSRESGVGSQGKSLPVKEQGQEQKSEQPEVVGTPVQGQSEEQSEQVQSNLKKPSGKGSVDGVNKKQANQNSDKPNQLPEQQPKQSGVKPPKGLESVLSKFGTNKAALDSKIGSNRQALNLQDNERQNKSTRLGGGKINELAEDKEKKDSEIDKETFVSGGSSPLKQTLGDIPQDNQGSEVGGQPGLPPEKKSESESDEERSKKDENPDEKQQEENPVIQPQPADDLSNVDQGVKSFTIAEAEKWLNTTVNVYLQTLATMVWAGALPTLGFIILVGAFGGDLILLLKDRVVREALKRTPLPKRFGNIKVEDLKININFAIKAQIALWNLITLLIFAFIGIFVFTIFWSLCNSPIYYTIRQTTLKSACEYLDSTKLSASLSNFQNTGSFVASNNTPGSLISTASWTDQINSTAQKWNIDACILRVVIQKESAGRADVIGCDCAANGHPEYCPDKRKTYSSDYQFNWAQCSYGIGLTQWTIYPKGGSSYKAWQDANTPSRQLYSSWYGVSDFLNPTTSLDLTAKAFSANLAKANGDVASAFAAYVGASNVQAQLVADRMALYNLCKNSTIP